MSRSDQSLKEVADAYVPTWERASLEVPNVPPPTGRRARGVSASSGSADKLSPSSHDSNRRRSHSSANTPGNGMLYFGTGLSPQHAMKTYTAGPRARSAGADSRGGGGGGGNASGRDASGYQTSGVGGASVMSGTYSSLTYGGSTQYNYSGTQSYGAGTGGGVVGGGLM